MVHVDYKYASNRFFKYNLYKSPRFSPILALTSRPRSPPPLPR